MRRIIIGCAVVVGLSALSTEAKAQGNFNDPFFLYYGWFLPRQAALSAQPTTPNLIRDVTTMRQDYHAAERQGLLDAAPPLGLEQVDPASPFSRNGSNRVPRATFGGNRTGSGVASHYNRTSRYYSNQGSGVNTNRNLASVRSKSRGMGSGVGPTMPGGPG